jgi:type VI secretion system secreted protein Hcp
MRKKALWGLVVAALVIAPAVVGLLVLGGDDARTQGALVQEGGAESYQLVITGVLGGGGTPAGQAIAVDSFSWGAENPTTIGTATGGAGAGKIKFNEFTITKTIDEMSPILYKQMATGAHAQTATLTIRKAGATKAPYATFTFKTVFITKIDFSGGSPETPTEQVTFLAGSWTLDSANPAVEGAKPQRFGWNQVLNKSDLT